MMLYEQNPKILRYKIINQREKKHDNDRQIIHVTCSSNLFDQRTMKFQKKRRKLINKIKNKRSET